MTNEYDDITLAMRLKGLQDRYRRLMLGSWAMGFAAGILFMALIRFAEAL